MVITVQDDMRELKRELKDRGYEVYFSSQGYAADVYIYSEKATGLINIYNSILPPVSGCFLINGDNKSINEIIYSIENRVYSPLI